MEFEIAVPGEVPVMTLPDVSFFPHALMPLHIFEPRYRKMLRDVLAGDRLFAVVGLDRHLATDSERFEPPHRIGGVGIVRACQMNDDGTSNLLLQGLSRIEVTGIVTDEPYRRIRVHTLASEQVTDPSANARRRDQLARLLALKQKLGAHISDEMAKYLRTISDPEVYVDLAAFGLCDDPALRQLLLETLDIGRRLELFASRTRREIGQLELQRRLQGGLADDNISGN